MTGREFRKFRLRLGLLQKEPLIEAVQGGLYRSDDGGLTWALASGHHALRQRAWYFSTLAVDPGSSGSAPTTGSSTSRATGEARGSR